ncbi:MAG: MMPL family transporter [Salibacteraceae bacterium]|nr:MMPL family transporter [Salibacteraceae bacterium]
MNLKTLSKLTLVLLFGITLFFGFQLKDLKQYYNFEDFFPKDHPDTEFFLDYRDKFGSDNDFALIGVRNQKGIFKQEFLTKIDSLSKDLSKIENVTAVLGPTNLKLLRKFDLYPKPVEFPVLHWKDSSKYAADSLKIALSEGFESRFFSLENQSVLIYINHVPKVIDTTSIQISRDINRVVSGHNFEEVHLGGRVVGQTVYIDLIKNETVIFIGTSFLFIILFLFFTYRSFTGVVLPLIIVGLSVTWTLGFMSFLGKTLDIVSTVLPSIIMVIGMSDVIHLTTHYRNMLSKMTKKEALSHSIKRVGLATLLTSLTTLVGFLTLLTSSVKPIIELGIFAAVGLMIALFLTYTCYVALLYLIPVRKEEINIQKNEIWKNNMLKINLFVKEKRNKILWFSLVLALVCAGLTSKLEINNYLLEDLRESHPQKVAYRFFEDNFGGARPFEVAVWAKSGASILDSNTIIEIQKAENFLKQGYPVDIQLSPITIFSETNRIINGGKLEELKIPTEERAFNKLLKTIKRNASKKEMTKLFSSNKDTSRISGTIGDWGRKSILERNEKFYDYVAENIDTNLVQFRITGSGHLLDLNTEKVSTNVIEGLVLAIALIGLIVGLLFRSFKMTLISIVPNVVPLLITSAIMAIFGIDLKISTAIIFVISFGIAVDDSIHFLTRFRLEMKQGRTVDEAMKNTFTDTGKSIVITTLIILSGFISLCASTFLSTFYIGFLISITLIAALICDLILLPALLYWANPKTKD